jgi:hypothetical protein
MRYYYKFVTIMEPIFKERLSFGISKGWFLPLLKAVWLLECKNSWASSVSRWVGTVLSRFLMHRREASIGYVENTSSLGHM